MSRQSRKAENEGFRRLSRLVSVYEPPESTKGQLIIVATWLNGNPKHIAKYTSLYKRLAPNARIMLIEGPMSNFLSPYPIQERNIRPAIEPIASVLKECDEHSIKPRILLHIFSNGGANNMLQLLRVWRSEKGSPLPLFGLVVDSSFGAGGPVSNYRGFQQTISSGGPIVRLLGPVAAVYALTVLETSIALGRYPRPETAIRQSIFDDSLLQMLSTGTCGESSSQEANTSHNGIDTSSSASTRKRICYFASKADQDTDYLDVLSHAKEAEDRGWLVEVHLWDDTGHCNHMAKHEEEYVEAVRNMWECGTPRAGFLRSKL